MRSCEKQRLTLSCHYVRGDRDAYFVAVSQRLVQAGKTFKGGTLPGIGNLCPSKLCLILKFNSLQSQLRNHEREHSGLLDTVSTTSEEAQETQVCTEDVEEKFSSEGRVNIVQPITKPSTPGTQDFSNCCSH